MFIYEYHCRLLNEKTGEMSYRRGTFTSPITLSSADAIRTSVHKEIGNEDSDIVISILQFKAKD